MRGITIHIMIALACLGRVGDAGAETSKKMEYLDNGIIRLGVDLSIGGAITYLAPSNGGTNMINSFDWGRQVQMSFYSDPSPYIPPSGEQPAENWANLGWNPIQSGDYGGNPSKVLEYTNDGESLYIKSVPMHWPHNNVPGECTFESWLTLEGNAVIAKARLNNARPDKTQYGARAQECPAVYSNGPWHRLVTYSGSKPFTGDAVMEIERREGPPWTRYFSTENWAALVNDHDEGFGVWTPGAYRFIGGYHGKTRGVGGPKHWNTGYVSPLFTEILDHNIQYSYEYRLIVGSLQNIRAYVYQHREEPASEFVFASDRQHWSLENAVDTGWPLQGEWHVKLEQDAPRLVGPDGCWQVDADTVVEIRAAFKTGESEAELLLLPFRPGRKNWKPSSGSWDRITFPVKGDGEWRTYRIAISEDADYRQTIQRIMIAPCRQGASGQFARIKSIRLVKSVVP